MEEAIKSVLKQSYKNIELIVVDDGSSDGSKKTISDILANTEIQFLSTPKVVGNCAAFNMGFYRSKGDFIIDLASDDRLLPERISEGLQTFNQKEIGVEFCNVRNISPSGDPIEDHFKLGELVPEGDIYLDLIKRYVISAPGMMIKREVLENLNGYDETLLYEDFDFWIRSSRTVAYGYTNKVLVEKRFLKKSHSSSQSIFRNKHQHSTLKVCQKIAILNRNSAENEALRKRVLYEIRQCLRTGNLGLIPAYWKIIKSNN